MMFDPAKEPQRSLNNDSASEPLAQNNQVIFVAEHETRLVGFLAAFGGSLQRNQHCADIVIGILPTHVGQGLGAQFFRVLEEWALQHHLHRLELTVMSHNERAVNLYRKMGYQTEGVKLDALWVNGKYVDEFYMAKLLS